MSNEQLKKKIMRRVYVIWFIRKLMPIVFIQAPFFLLVVLRETAHEFFVAKIIENFISALNSGPIDLINFIASAIVNAPVLPMLIIVFSFCFLTASVYRAVRVIKGLSLVKI
jgi:hypothetical protein